MQKECVLDLEIAARHCKSPGGQNNTQTFVSRNRKRNRNRQNRLSGTEAGTVPFPTETVLKRTEDSLSNGTVGAENQNRSNRFHARTVTELKPNQAHPCYYLIDSRKGGPWPN